MELPKKPTGKTKLSAWLLMAWHCLRAARPKDSGDIVFERQGDGFRAILKKHPRAGKEGGGGSIIRATIAGGINSKVDFFSCNVDGESGLVRVAKPYLLRVSPFDGLTVNGVRYDYFDGQLRQARLPGISSNYVEDQAITPSWQFLETIFVTKNPEGGTGVPTADYLDINADGRCWAEYFRPPT